MKKAAEDIKQLSVKELEEKLLELRTEQFKLRMKRANGSLDKFHRFGQLRKLIAQVKTFLTQKKREVAHHG